MRNLQWRKRGHTRYQICCAIRKTSPSSSAEKLSVCAAVRLLSSQVEEILLKGQKSSTSTFCTSPYFYTQLKQNIWKSACCTFMKKSNGAFASLHSDENWVYRTESWLMRHGLFSQHSPYPSKFHTLPPLFSGFLLLKKACPLLQRLLIEDLFPHSSIFRFFCDPGFWRCYISISHRTLWSFSKTRFFGL